MENFIVSFDSDGNWDIKGVSSYSNLIDGKYVKTPDSELTIDGNLSIVTGYGLHSKDPFPTPEQVAERLAKWGNKKFRFLGYWFENLWPHADFAQEIEKTTIQVEKLKNLHEESYLTMKKHLKLLTTDGTEWTREGYVIRGISIDRYKAEKAQSEAFDAIFNNPEPELINFKRYVSWETGIHFLILNERVSDDTFKKLVRCGLFYHKYDAELEERFNGWCIRPSRQVMEKMIQEKLRYVTN